MSDAAAPSAFTARSGTGALGSIAAVGEGLRGPGSGATRPGQLHSAGPMRNAGSSSSSAAGSEAGEPRAGSGHSGGPMPQKGVLSAVSNNSEHAVEVVGSAAVAAAAGGLHFQQLQLETDSPASAGGLHLFRDSMQQHLHPRPDALTPMTDSPNSMAQLSPPLLAVGDRPSRRAHLRGDMSSSTRWPELTRLDGNRRKWVLLGCGALAFILAVIRDRRRRAAGLERRSFVGFIASSLLKVNSSISRMLAMYISAHPKQTYFAVVVLLVASYYNQAWLMRFWRRWRQHTTQDVLTEYPDEPNLDVDDAASVASERPESPRAATPVHGDDRVTVDFFMQHVSQLTQSLDAETAEAVYQRLESVQYKKGDIVFKTGDSADHGMLMVMDGEMCIEAEVDSDGKRPEAGRRIPLFTCRVGQSVGENALLEGPEATRIVTCRARSDLLLKRFDRTTFQWVLDNYPHAIVSFILTTTSRQWKVAYFTLVEFFQVPGAWQLACETNTPVGLSAASLRSGADGIVTLRRGELLLSLGDECDRVYVVLSGSAESTRIRGDETDTQVLTAGCVAGGISTFVGMPAQSSVVVTSDRCEFAYFDQTKFVQFAQAGRLHTPSSRDDPRVGLAMFIARCMTRLLKMFLECGIQRQLLRAGEVLFKQGDPADGVYIVISGRIRNFVSKQKAYIDSDGDSDPENQRSNDTDDLAFERQRVTVEVGRGESLGELCVLTNETHREFSAMAVRDVEAVHVSIEAFHRLVSRHPPVMRIVTSMMADRYRKVTQSLSWNDDARVLKRSEQCNLVTLALLPAGHPTPDMDAFAHQLLKALGSEGSVKLITSQVLDRELGAGTSSGLTSIFERSRVAAYLSVQEENNRFLVFQTDSHATAWSRLCVRHADCILLVGSGTATSVLSELERELIFQPRILYGDEQRAGPGPRSVARKELVLLHSPSVRPKRTRDWLRVRTIGGHHHIRTPIRSDFERLVRHLSGKATGVVFGGGGARGLAHLGVLATMEEKHIPIDYIGGTSQGAFMAACYAMTLSSEECLPCAKVLASRIGSVGSLLTDLTLPIISYFSGEHFNDALQEVFGDTQIEDLWIRYFCITTNVTRSSMGVHTTGPLWRYARASMTVMGLLPPLIIQGDLTVDGGYVNNLPVDVMSARFGPKTIIAVDVEDKDQSAFRDLDQYGDSLSGWRVFGGMLLSMLRLGPRVRIPFTSSVTLNLAYISHSMMCRRMLAQRSLDGDDGMIYIRPDIQQYGLLNYDKLPEIVEKGAAAARRAFRSKHRGSDAATPPAMSRTMSILDLHAAGRDLNTQLLRRRSMSFISTNGLSSSLESFVQHA